jgi:hypothetical protein
VDVEHKVEMFGAGWTPKGWQERLDELAADGWRFAQCVDRVDGFMIILLRAARRGAPPASTPRA